MIWTSLYITSLNDVSTVIPRGCDLRVFPHREDPTDALVFRTDSPYRTLEELPSGSVVGTSSAPRTAQLKHFHPHVDVQECRGNVSVSAPSTVASCATDANIISHSRLAKLDAPNSPFTAIVIATEALIRLNLERRITARLFGPHFLHVIGQRALGIGLRSGDERTRELMKPLDHWPTRMRCSYLFIFFPLSKSSCTRFLVHKSFRCTTS